MNDTDRDEFARLASLRPRDVDPSHAERAGLAARAVFIDRAAAHRAVPAFSALALAAACAGYLVWAVSYVLPP